MDFCLQIDGVQPQKSQSDAARLKTASQKEHTSLKARKALDFKGKGVLLRAFALVCGLSNLLCSMQHNNMCTTQQQRPKTKTKTKTKKKKKSKKKKKKDLRNTICVFQHANCRDPP